MSYRGRARGFSQDNRGGYGRGGGPPSGRGRGGSFGRGRGGGPQIARDKVHDVTVQTNCFAITRLVGRHRRVTSG